MKDVKRFKFVYDETNSCWAYVLDPSGEYVLYEDYSKLSDYADSLVDLSKIPCLPRDLENLRNSNAHFADENFKLSNRVRELEAEVAYLKASLKVNENDIVGWRNKWDAAVTIAAIAENKIQSIKQTIFK